MEWKPGGIRLCLAAAIMGLALLAVILNSCGSHKESTVDYGISSTDSYQERRAEEHERQLGVRRDERHDTVRETAAQSGQIEIERDTAGRAVKIIYEHVFDGVRTLGSSRIDTVVQRQVVILRDSAGSGQNKMMVDGRATEKKDVGFSLAKLVIICFFVCLGIIFIYILVKHGKD